MAIALPLIAIASLAVGVRFGAAVRESFGWSSTVVTLLLIASLLPWFVHHGHVLDALRFGAIQSEWTHPAAFGRVHGTAYAVTACVVVVSGLLTRTSRWALVFAPGLAFLGVAAVVLPMARGAVADGYFLLPGSATNTFWVATLAMTGVLLGFAWRPRNGDLGHSAESRTP